MPAEVVRHIAPPNARLLDIPVCEDPRREGVRLMPYPVTLDVDRATNGSSAEPVVRYTGTDDSEDRYGTVISMDGWEIADYMRSATKPGTDEEGGVFLFAHIYDALPIGRTFKLDMGKKRATFHVRYAVEWLEFAARAYVMVREGFMSGSSVGFIPKQAVEYESQTVTGWFADNTRYIKQELLELSATPVPANRNALANDLSRAVRDGKITEADVRMFGFDNMQFRMVPMLLNARGIPRTFDDPSKRFFEDKRDPAHVPVQQRGNESAGATVAAALDLAEEVADMLSLAVDSLGTTRTGARDADHTVRAIVRACMHARAARATGDLSADAVAMAIVCYRLGWDAEEAQEFIRTFAALPATERAGAVLNAKNKADLGAAKAHNVSAGALIDGVLASAEKEQAAKDDKEEEDETIEESADRGMLRLNASHIDAIVNGLGRDTSDSTTSPTASPEGDSSTTVTGSETSRGLQTLAALGDGDIFSRIFTKQQ